MKYPIENRIQASIIDYCKKLEGNIIFISGSDLAKKLSYMVAVGLLTDKQRIVYYALTDSPKNIKTISKETRISAVQVKSHLKTIYAQTQLVSFKKDGVSKLWFK